MITTQTIRKALIPKQAEEIGRIFEGDRLKNKDRFLLFFKEVDSPQEYVEIQTDEARAEATLHLEGSTLDEINPVDGQSMRVHQMEFGCYFKWTERVRKFQKMDVIARMTRVMGETPNEVYNSRAFAHIELGTSLSNLPSVKGVKLVNPRSIDKLPLWSTAHTFNSGGQTNSNYLAAISLDETGLNTLADLPLQWRDENGVPVQRKIKYLVVPYQLRHDAYRVLGTEKQPETGNNDVNTVRQDFGPGDYRVARDLENQSVFYAVLNSRHPWKLRHGWKPDVQRDRDGLSRCEVTTMTFAHSLETADWSAGIRCGG